MSVQDRGPSQVCTSSGVLVALEDANLVPACSERCEGAFRVALDRQATARRAGLSAVGVHTIDGTAADAKGGTAGTEGEHTLRLIESKQIRRAGSRQPCRSPAR